MKDTFFNPYRSIPALATMFMSTTLFLTGCGTEVYAPGPTVVETPKIIWQDGITPTSPLEQDTLVKTARAAEVGAAMAWNMGDFTIAQFTNNWTHEYAVFLSDLYTSGTTSVHVSPGPSPWTPIRIVESNSRGGIIEVCALETHPRERSWLRSSSGPGGYYDRTDASLYQITLTKERGRYRLITQAYSQPKGPCDGSTVPVGYFDPQPKLPKKPIDPIRTPLPIEDTK